MFFENNCLYNYADDNTISVCHQDINIVVQLLRNYTNVSTMWFSENHMQASPSKFQAIIIQHGQTQTPVHLDISGIYMVYIYKNRWRCRNWFMVYMCMLILVISYDSISPGPTFIKPDQRNPWIKDQIKITLLPTISHLLLPNFVSCGRACPSHMTQNLVTVGAKLWTADRFIIDPWSMDYADPVW